MAGRRDHQYDKILCVKGIDQQDGIADPALTCSDALNVWAPDGEIVSRPGYVGLDGYGLLEVVGVNPRVISEDVSAGTFATGSPLVIGGLVEGDRIYFTADNFSATTTVGFTYWVGVSNTEAVYANWEYWNGTHWVSLSASTVGYPRYTSLPFNGSLTYTVNFATPNDWATTTITAGGTAYTKYFIRAVLWDDSVAPLPLTAGSRIDLGNFGVQSARSTAQTFNPGIFGIFAPQFPSVKRYLTLTATFSSSAPWVYNRDALVKDNNFYFNQPTIMGAGRLANMAVVPQFEEAYIAYNDTILVFKAYPTASVDSTARVEDDPALIGPNADYAPDLVPQLGAFPRAKFIEFFQGQLWAANFLDDPFSIRWSAPQPAYRIWPTLNIETLMENDNSHISGIKGFQSHMTVFKSDSIWRMVDSGISEFSLQTYVAERVVNGVGCVSHASVAEVLNRLVLLAEDGIYAYDGTSQVQKLSARIQRTIDSITPGRRPFAVGVNWKSKNLYLLSVSVNGSDENNLVIVWDYKNDAFWLWDNVDAQTWLLDEDAADNERLYFGDAYGRIYELGVGHLDHGATIDSYFVSQKQKGEDHVTRRLRSVEVASTNATRSLALTVMPNGTPESDCTAVAIDFTDETEKDWGEHVWAVDKYVSNRDRIRKSGQAKAGEWFQIKLAHSVRNAPMEIDGIQLGYIPLGRRR